MTKFHLFSQDSVSLPSNGRKPWLETAPTGGVRKSYKFQYLRHINENFWWKVYISRRGMKTPPTDFNTPPSNPHALACGM